MGEQEGPEAGTMQVLVDVVETWLVRLAVVLGAIAILLPLLNVWRARNVRRGRTAGWRPRLLRWPAVFALAVAYVAAGILLWKPVLIQIDPNLRLALALVGGLLYFPGVALYLWGYRTLGRLFGVSSSAAAELYGEHRLIDSGPYAIVRHPMYLGVLLAAFGALLLFRTWAMIIFTPMSLLVIARARREEKLMADEFGEHWDSYTKRVPGWVPKPWARSKDSRSSGS